MLRPANTQKLWELLLRSLPVLLLPLPLLLLLLLLLLRLRLPPCVLLLKPHVQGSAALLLCAQMQQLRQDRKRVSALSSTLHSVHPVRGEVTQQPASKTWCCMLVMHGCGNTSHPLVLSLPS